MKKLNLIFIICLIVGLGFIGYGIFTMYKTERALSFDANPYPDAAAMPNAEASTSENTIARISIDSLGIDLPVYDTIIRDGVWQISPDGISHLRNSAVPRGDGNIIMYGHNKRARHL